MERDPENLVKDYYRYNNKIELLQDKYNRVEKRIAKLRKDIKECNVDIDYSIKGIDYSKDPSGNKNERYSSVEQEVEKALNSLMNNLKRSIKEKYTIKERIYEIIETKDAIEPVLNQLTEDEKRLLDMRYSNKRGKPVSFRKLESKIPLSYSSIHEAHRSIMDFIEESIKE